MKSNVIWSGVEAAASGLVSLLSAFVIARLIGPSELGIGAAAVSGHVLLWVVVNALFADALVQRAEVDDTVACSAFWASVATGFLAVPVQIGTGYVLAWWLDDSRFIPMAMLLALPLPLVGAGGAVQGMLTRARRYRALAARTILGQGLGAAAGVVLAVHHDGAWAPVTQLAVGSFVGAATLLLRTAWRPRLVWSGPAVRGLLSIGLPLTASTLMQLSRYRIFTVLIGGTAGSTALGEVHIAFRLVDTVRELTFTALWRLMLPILSEQQHDRAQMLTTVDRLLRQASRILLPLCGVFAVCLIPVVAAVLGPSYAPAGHAAMPLIALMVLLGLMFPSGVAAVASGRARFALYANAANMLATILGVVLFHPADPMQAVLVWCSCQLLICPYTLWMNARILGVGLLRPLRAGFRILLPTGAVAGTLLLCGALYGRFVG